MCLLVFKAAWEPLVSLAQEVVGKASVSGSWWDLLTRAKGERISRSKSTTQNKTQINVGAGPAHSWEWSALLTLTKPNEFLPKSTDQN